MLHDTLVQLTEPSHQEKFPKVLIGIPVYNAESFIPTTLDSLLAQTYENFEIIISDNGSTDATPQVIHDYMRRDSRIRYIQQSYNLGVVDNLNFVLEEAQRTEGEYFMWSCADDWKAPTFLEKAVSVLEEHPNVICVFCNEVAFSHISGNIVRKTFNVSSHGTPAQRLATRILNVQPDILWGLHRKNMCSKLEKFDFSDTLHPNLTAIKGDIFILNEILHGKGFKTEINRIPDSVEGNRFTYWPFLKANCKLIINNFTGMKRVMLLILAIRQGVGFYITYRIGKGM